LKLKPLFQSLCFLEDANIHQLKPEENIGSKKQETEN